MTTTTNAKPASQGGATFLDISGSRKMTNNIATAVVWGAMILAMVPLVWFCGNSSPAAVASSSTLSGGPPPSAAS